ncbi:hypothetical protein N0V84_002920 [Fusarium piperis]|uniref:Uncharacterized protein n=1 Tax=Fusarium piperis TaxID=1435070 RepID=A0A9W8WID0_9HYPO|nr:hypothetical protein N0V84_002920 [Fusarium piperis]
MDCWQMLPGEIQLMILETLARDPAAEGETEHPLTQYSLVCRDWQVVFERHLYRSLNIDWPSLWAFDDIVCRQRRFVEHIRLNIDMETYECLGCTRFDIGRLAIENVRVSDTLMCLFHILSHWRPGVDCPEGVTLEITGYPRTEDGCVRISPDPFPRPPDEGSGKPAHLGPQYRQDDLGLRLLLDFGPGLAQVQVVRKLVVPRKSRYRLSEALEPMIDSLPNLYQKTVVHDDDDDPDTVEGS